MIVNILSSIATAFMVWGLFMFLKKRETNKCPKCHSYDHFNVKGIKNLLQCKVCGKKYPKL